MDYLKSFYELKVKTIENIDYNLCFDNIGIEQYLKNYSKLYKIYEFCDEKHYKDYQQKILDNIKIIVDDQKNKIKKQLENESCNLIEISNEYSNFIAFLYSLREKYPEFKDSIIIDDMA